MSNPRPFTPGEVCAEVEYILSVDPENPGKTFNWDAQCFRNYVDMQARAFIAQGLDVTATQIRAHANGVRQ